MARVIYSGLVTEINGSIGGTTFQRNNFGFTIRQKPNIVKPKKVGQIKHQQIMSNVVRGWQAISRNDRNAWIAFAHSFPQYAIHNKNAQLTGFHVFLKVNVFLLSIGLTLRTSPVQQTYNPDPCIVSLQNSAGTLYCDGVFDNQNEDYYVIIYLSSICKPTNNGYSGAFGLITYNLSSDFHLDVTNYYQSLFGYVPPTGSYINCYLRYVGVDNGQFLAKINSQIIVS